MVKELTISRKKAKIGLFFARVTWDGRYTFGMKKGQGNNTMDKKTTLRNVGSDLKQTLFFAFRKTLSENHSSAGGLLVQASVGYTDI